MGWIASVESLEQWVHRPWVDFPAASGQIADRLVVWPWHGMADHGLGLPLDAEEVVGSAVLEAAGKVRAAAGQAGPLLLPPLRWLGWAGPHTVLALPWEEVRAQAMEWARTLRRSGLRRLLLFNTSPWNEELADLTARDLRVDLGLTLFVVNSAALGLDFHPVRGRLREGGRADLVAIVQDATGQTPAPGRAAAPRLKSTVRPQPLLAPGRESVRLAPARAGRQAAEVLARAGAHLERLWSEIETRPLLPHDGRVAGARWPAGEVAS